ncbi:hypothetical protein K437DRAFT_253272 [Tilletiaria anomala UBC 951]|uniref:Ion transport domain-containing protein n=1 Tax=Tilletiaria anomala (strain ATCC 24038 / CBS 436.72 / UBC 951) TaxID=1037660 RepID=A0A066WQG2_TILAU|nr:uncharacterized protein K437DRAFT_253272 [Tilletiaria anomala UBC 951]KDN53254.1 hypothetical protein K437DRAFT_253272 [Tilletiaria anomala UBC 951]
MPSAHHNIVAGTSRCTTNASGSSIAQGGLSSQRRSVASVPDDAIDVPSNALAAAAIESSNNSKKLLKNLTFAPLDLDKIPASPIISSRDGDDLFDSDGREPAAAGNPARVANRGASGTTGGRDARRLQTDFEELDVISRLSTQRRQAGEGGHDARVDDLFLQVERQRTYPLIHLIHQDVKRTIDTHLTWEELTSVDLNFALVRPLAVKYAKLRSPAVIYGFLFNKIQFLREASADIAFQQINATRGMMCELLAIKLLRTFSADGIELVTVLTAPFSPFNGIELSPRYQEQLRRQQEANHSLDLSESDTTRRNVMLANASGFCSANPNLSGNGSRFNLGGRGQQRDAAQASCSALELALFSSSKKFIKSPLCQKVVQGIWEGTVVISSASNHAILNDDYKRKPLSIYDPRTAPLLNHYRLKVPQVRSRLEFLNFIILFGFFILCLGQKESPTWTTWETLFTIWLAGFALDEVAQAQEHGWNVYLGSVWNLIDSLFVVIATVWLGMRVIALRTDNADLSSMSFDILALGAVLLCPRVASALVRDNIVLLALREMLADFAFFIGLAAVCFSGFWYAFYTLSDHEKWPPFRILDMMLKIWFGNTFIGFDAAQNFNEVIGPPLMVLYSIVSNTLLLTVLVSLLSNTFSVVRENAAEEVQFHHTFQTLAGVSTDALFSYVPPLNLLCVTIVYPASFILTPRWIHKLNVFLIRFTSFPILLGIHVAERWKFRSGFEITAKRAGQVFTWLPLSISGKAGSLEVIDEVFISEHDMGNDAQSSWESEALKQVQEQTNVDADAAHRLSRQLMEQPGASPHPDARSNAIQENDVGTALSGGESARRRPSDDGYIQGFGHLSSPLAKLFGRRNRAGDNMPDGSNRQVETEQQPLDTDALLTKIERLEKQNERMEDLLRRLIERYPA